MNTDLLKTELINDEGFRSKPYLDTQGKTTIGVGRNLSDNGITREEAAFLLSNDIAKVERDLDSALPWWRVMSEVRQRVLCNMAFNMGLPRLRKFENTLKSMQAGDYEMAANGMLSSLWAQQVKDRAQRLANMMRTG